MPTPRRPRWTPPNGCFGEGKLLGMYPEGTRSPDGRLYKGKTGLARLALQTGVPVIPVAMIGTNVVNPPGTTMLRFGRVTVRFGKPMDFSRFEGLAGNRFIERAVTDEVIYELMGLSGQEYVDIYAASVKERGNGSAGQGSTRRGRADPRDRRRLTRGVDSADGCRRRQLLRLPNPASDCGR